MNDLLAINNDQTRFRTIFEHSPVGNKIIDSSLKILQVNMAMVRLLGFSNKEEIEGTKILDFTPEEYQKDWKKLQEQLWTHKLSSFSLESALLRRDGTLIRCRVTSILFEDHGETLGYTSIEDITEQFLLRQQKEDFIMVASHELKTPVTTLKASIQMMRKLMSPGKSVSDQLVRLAVSADSGAKRLTTLLNDLLNLTRLEYDELSINKSWFEIGELLNSCCSHESIDDKYTLNYIGDPKLMVFADQFKIDQVIVNLINNAIKFSPDHNEIVINAVSDGSAVTISVKDQGKGIDAAVQPFLFDRYYRVNTNSSAGDPGLGLGLYICAEIVKKHGGEIGVDSEIGQGANFWFSLPKY